MDNSDIRIEKYSAKLKKAWDNFVAVSKNGTFLFFRDYMEYHSTRFIDHSLVIYRKEKIYALLPATLKGDVVYSHSGLTFGGIIMSKDCGASGILEVFEEIKNYYRAFGINVLIYKPTPHIYHSLPSEEDLYAIFRNNGILSCRNISSTIYMTDRLPIRKDRVWNFNKAKREGINVYESTDYEGFWKILEENLKTKYSTRPTHSLEEMLHLSCLFQEHIKLYIASKNSEMLAGVVCYINKNVVHTQYISANEDGKGCGAIDMIIVTLLDLYSKVKYFDFGTSNEANGNILNSSLIYQKEGFGARAVCYDTYTILL